MEHVSLILRWATSDNRMFISFKIGAGWIN